MRWGLVPSWAKDTTGGARMINARAETVAVKPAFRAAFARRRCLIPADGYYEWMTEDKAKQPYYIYRTDGGILAFAGIYELWRDSQVPEDHEDAWYWSASIITTQATDDIGRIHDRTPMVIAPDDWTDWLDPANNEKELLLAIDAARDILGGGRPDVVPRFDGRQLRAEQRARALRSNRPSATTEQPPGSSPSSEPSLLHAPRRTRRWRSALPVSA